MRICEMTKSIRLLVLALFALVVLESCVVLRLFQEPERVCSVSAYDRFGYQVYARVYMDGHLVGKTPWKGNPSLKEHEFVLENWRYPKWMGRIDASQTSLVARFVRNMEQLADRCSNQDAWSCFWLSEEILSSYSSANAQVRQNVQRYQMLAARLASDSCKQGDSSMCALLGYFYLTESGRPKDVDRAIELTEQVCKTQKDMLACYVYGRSMLEKSAESGGTIPTDAVAALADACNHPIPDACGYLAEASLNEAFVAGTDGKPDAKELDAALERFEFACSHGSAYGCARLGEMYFKGSNVEENPYVAEPLLVKGCNLLDGRACYYLARLALGGMGPQEVSPQELLQKACMLGFKKGCSDVR